MARAAPIALACLGAALIIPPNIVRAALLLAHAKRAIDENRPFEQRRPGRRVLFAIVLIEQRRQRVHAIGLRC